MAYMSQEKKAEIVANLKKALAGSNVKWTVSVHHHSTICLSIASGPIDFAESYNRLGVLQSRYPGDFQPCTNNHLQVNQYHYRDHYDGEALAFLEKAIPCLFGSGYFDRSDIQTDYFDCSWYVRVDIGKWNKPYVKIEKNGDTVNPSAFTNWSADTARQRVGGTFGT